eukprot:3178914-Prymnesium_polylepis.1
MRAAIRIADGSSGSTGQRQKGIMYPAATRDSRKLTQSWYELKLRSVAKSTVLPTSLFVRGSRWRRACILAGSQLSRKTPDSGGYSMERK